MSLTVVAPELLAESSFPLDYLLFSNTRGTEGEILICEGVCYLCDLAVNVRPAFFFFFF